MNKYTFFTVFNILFFLLISTFSYSQTIAGPPAPSSDDETGSGPAFGDDDVPDEIVPIDGLIYLGLIVGSVYGIRRKYYKKEA